ncbi:MAG: hypothetical protein HY689_12210 [Chloroflexi bacterium]|nr:hypothetical protein [Chloroflexota bacterium]
MPVRFTLVRVLDSRTVPDLNQPTSLAVDSQGNLVLCDCPEGRPTVSRLLAQAGYHRQPVADAGTFGAPPVLVRVGPRDALYVGCFPQGGQPCVRRISAAGQREQPYALPGIPADFAVDREGKLWVIYRERSQGLSLQAYGPFGAPTYDYEAAVEEARDHEVAPPLFIDGQYLTVAPDGDLWFGAVLEQTSCVRLAPDGRWRYWDYPSSFTDAHGFTDYCGLAAADATTLLTTDFRALDGGPAEQYLVEIDLERRRFSWTSLADLGLPDMREPAEPSIWDLAWRDGLLYLCDYTYHRIIILRGDSS